MIEGGIIGLIVGLIVQGFMALSLRNKPYEQFKEKQKQLVVKKHLAYNAKQARMGAAELDFEAFLAVYRQNLTRDAILCFILAPCVAAILIPLYLFVIIPALFG